jgi:hypothetical protein
MRRVPFSHSSTSALLLSPLSLGAGIVSEDLGFALESLDVSSLGAGIVSKDLPVVLGNPLHFKRDSGFAHANEYGSFEPDGKPNVRGGLALASGLTAASMSAPFCM